MQPALPIQISQAKIAEFCQRHHIRRLSLFGSVLRDDFSPTSDVDVLVEFEPGKIPGFAIVTLQQESHLLGDSQLGSLGRLKGAIAPTSCLDRPPNHSAKLKGCDPKSKHPLTLTPDEFPSPPQS
jgi:uncharacterized protein